MFHMQILVMALMHFICISLSLVVSVLYANIGHGMFVIYRRNLSKVWMCFTCFKGWMCFIWKYFWWGGCVSYVNICHGLDVFHTQRFVMCFIWKYLSWVRCVSYEIFVMSWMYFMH